MKNSRGRLFASLPAVWACGVSLVFAQSYPAKPIKLLVPFGAGGITDIVARITGDELRQKLAQPVVIENRPGAGGNIAGEAAAKAAPDGYTLMMTTAALLTVNPHLYARMPFDPFKDFTFVSLVASTPHVIVVNPGVEAGTLQALVALAKAKPESLAFGTAGNGSSPHQGLALLQFLTQARFLHVPFKSGSESVTNVIAGNVQMTFEAIPVVIPHVQSGKLRALALASPRRNGAMPELPTTAEAGVSGLETGSVSGVLGPAGLPAAVVATLERTLREVLATSRFREHLSAQGSDPIGSTPEEFRAAMQEESARWAKVFKQTGIKLQ